MDIYYIENKIEECKKGIEDNNYNIKILKNKIKDFEYTVEKLKETQRNLQDYRDFKKAKFVSMKENLSDMKFANLCADSMTNFIDGSESIKAHENIYESIKASNRKINEKEEEIYDLERRNVNLEEEIFELERELELERNR